MSVRLKIAIITNHEIIKCMYGIYSKPQVKFMEYLSTRFDQVYILAPVRKINSDMSCNGKYIKLDISTNINIIELPYFQGTADQIKKFYLLPIVMYKYITYVNKVDLVLIYNRDLFSTMGLFVAKLFDKKVVYIIGDIWRNNVMYKYKSKLFLNFLHILEFIQKKLLKYRKNNSLILATLNPDIEVEIKNWGITYDKYFASLISEGSIFYKEKISFSSKKSVNILYVGWLIESKGVQDLIRAVYKLQKSIGAEKDIILNIVGDGYYKSTLEQLAKDLKINAKFYGLIGDREKLLNVYRKNDIFVLPSYSEGYPKVIFEACSQGLITVCTDAIYIENLCVKYKAGCINELVDILSKIINDDNYANYLLNNQYSCIRSYTLEKSVSRIYKSIIKHLYSHKRG